MKEEEEEEKDMTANDKKDTEDEDGLLQHREFNAWDQEDIFFEQCLSTSKKEFISLTKWKAGQVGCFCREHCQQITYQYVQRREENGPGRTVET